MSPIFVALVLLSQPASQPASQPVLQGGGRISDVVGELTYLLEADENHVKVQESWRFQNDSGRTVSPDQFRLLLPPTARRLTVDEDAKGFEATEDSTAIIANRALGAGTTEMGAAYLLDVNGGSANLSRTLPFRVGGARAILLKVPGVEVEASLRHQRRERDLNGLNFLVFDFEGGIPAGGRFDLQIDGLPSPRTWPKWAAMAVVAAILGWVVWSIQLPVDHRRSRAGSALSPEARRDQILRAIELLERDRTEERIKGKRYERRHAELMHELASVLREIQVAAHGTSPLGGQRSAGNPAP